MRRLLAIAAALAVAVAVLVLGTGAGGDDGTYEVRAVFDNASFLVTGEEVRVAGAKVGSVTAVDIATADEPVTEDGSPDPGKAIVVMQIDDPAFQDFRTDASCLIRPQSLIGEKFVECTADRAARARQPGAAPAGEDPRRPAGRRPVPAAAGAQRQGRRPRPGQQHHARAVPRPVPADPQRPRRRARGPRRRARRDRRAREPGSARDQQGDRDPALAEPRPRRPRHRRRPGGHRAGAGARERRRVHQLLDHGRAGDRRAPGRPRGRLREAARLPARAALDDGRADQASPTPRRRSSASSAPRPHR